MAMTTAPTSTSLTVEPIGGHLGARVTGLDLTDRSAATGPVLRALLDEHLVLVLPAQHALDDDAQRELMLQLGDGYIHPLGRAGGQTEATAGHIVDDADHPPYQDRWHTDVTWDPEPPTVGSLRAIDIPERGGDTLFASMYAAYDALSSSMQAMIAGLTAKHGLGDSMAFISKAGPELTARAAEACADTHHPVVGHVDGRPHLYVNRQFTESIDGLAEAESDALLRVLCDHAESPNWQIRHRWTEGDVVLWDERVTLHFAAADHQPARREMARFVVR